MAPISVFISRATQRLYVRQALQPLFESEVTIADPDEPLGTYVFTALAYASDETDLRWNAVSMYDGALPCVAWRATDSAPGGPAPPARRRARPTSSGCEGGARPHFHSAGSARPHFGDRIPRLGADRLRRKPLSRETGQATEFIVVMSGEPQGGIKIRRRDPKPRSRYERFMRRGPYGLGPSFW